MNNQDTYGKENGNSKVAEGEPVIFGNPSEAFTDRLEDTTAALFTQSSGNLVRLDVERLIPIAQAISTAKPYIQYNAFKSVFGHSGDNHTAKVQSLMQDTASLMKYKTETYDCIYNALKSCEDIINKESEICKKAIGGNTQSLKDSNIPKTIRNKIYRSITDSINAINSGIEDYAPANEDDTKRYSDMIQIAEYINDMTIELNQTSRLVEAMILAENLGVKFKELKEYLPLRSDHVDIVKKLRKFAKGKKAIKYEMISEDRVDNIRDEASKDPSGVDFGDI